MSLSGVSLDAATSVGAGDEFWVDTPKTRISAQIHVEGNPTEAEVSVEVTLDGVFWKPFAIYAFSGSGPDHIAGTDLVTPFLGFRANLTSLSGGSSPTVTALLAVA